MARNFTMLTPARYDGIAHQPVMTKRIDGLLRVFLIEGKNLVAADSTLPQMLGLGAGSSDPYCLLQVGRTRVKTNVIKRSLNPVWNFYCEFVVPVDGAEELEIYVMDQDIMKSDEEIGNLTVDLAQLRENKGEITEILGELKSALIAAGQVRLRLQFDPCIKPSDGLVLPLNNAKPYSRAALILFVRSVQSSVLVEPILSVHVFGGSEHISSLKGKGKKWDFEEELIVLVENPESDWICIRVVESNDVLTPGKFFQDALFRKKQKDKDFQIENIKKCNVIGEKRFPARMFYEKRVMSERFELKEQEAEVKIKFEAALCFFGTQERDSLD